MPRFTVEDARSRGWSWCPYPGNSTLQAPAHSMALHSAGCSLWRSLCQHVLHSGTVGWVGEAPSRVQPPPLGGLTGWRREHPGLSQALQPGGISSLSGPARAAEAAGPSPGEWLAWLCPRLGEACPAVPLPQAPNSQSPQRKEGAGRLAQQSFPGPCCPSHVDVPGTVSSDLSQTPLLSL